MSEKNYPQLPGPCSTYYDDIDHEEVRCYSGQQMRAYVDADRAQRLPLTNEQIERTALEHEDFGFGRADKSGLSTHGFGPEGLRAFAHAIIRAAHGMKDPS